jgi:hypothetical protein
MRKAVVKCGASCESLWKFLVWSPKYLTNSSGQPRNQLFAMVPHCAESSSSPLRSDRR